MGVEIEGLLSGTEYKQGKDNMMCMKGPGKDPDSTFGQRTVSFDSCAKSAGLSNLSFLLHFKAETQKCTFKLAQMADLHFTIFSNFSFLHRYYTQQVKKI